MSQPVARNFFNSFFMIVSLICEFSRGRGVLIKLAQQQEKILRTDNALKENYRDKND